MEICAQWRGSRHWHTHWLLVILVLKTLLVDSYYLYSYVGQLGTI